MERLFYLGDPSRFLSGALDRKDRVSLISGFSLKNFLEKKNQFSFDCLILDGRAGFGLVSEWLHQLECHSFLPPLILAIDEKTPIPGEIRKHDLLSGIYEGAPLLPELIEGSRFILSRREREKVRDRAGRTSYLGITGTSPSIRELWEKIDKYALHREYSVLIQGENGTGKDLVARALHLKGHGEEAPFVVYQASSSGQSLMPSELLGVRKGAYTGSENRQGLFAQADGGVFFMDEVGTLSPENQITLLRVLEEKKFRPLGGNGEISSRFRLVSATNEDLASAVEEGRFRRDLYHRINTLMIKVPSLRERKVDIPFLVDHFLSLEGESRRFSHAALKKLGNHTWPGNVREFRNVVLRSLVECGNSGQIEARHVYLD